ncbi:hypothetical protein [Leisingera sp. JC11]|uniref:hypothetical protein n=1 Tax=Leisingera sp. JC11 TaxID=3042469 RepID=UPI003452D3BD
MIRSFWHGLLALVLMVSVVHADCLENEKIPVFRELKEHMLSGNYDAFFEASDHTKALSEATLNETKVKLVQYLGVPKTCVMMAMRRYSENFVASLTAFVGSNGQYLYAYFASVRIEGEDELVWVQISTDFSEILSFVN